MWEKADSKIVYTIIVIFVSAIITIFFSCGQSPVQPNPITVELVGQYPTNQPSTVGIFSVYNGYAYVSEDYSIKILDVSNPSLIIQVGQIDSISPSEMHADLNYLYVKSFLDTLKIFDIHDPQNAVCVGSCGTGVPYAFGHGFMQRSGNFIYLSGFCMGLRIINIEDRSNPELIGFYPDSYGKFDDLAVSNEHVFIFLRMAYSMCCIDVSDPSTPTLISSCPAGTVSGPIFATDDFLYAVKSRGKLEILNVEDPINPVLMDRIRIDKPIYKIYADEKYAYLMTHREGFQIFDISNKNNIVKVYEYSGLTNPRVLIAENGYIYINEDYGKILIFKISE